MRTNSITLGLIFIAVSISLGCSLDNKIENSAKEKGEMSNEDTIRHVNTCMFEIYSGINSILRKNIDPKLYDETHLKMVIYYDLNINVDRKIESISIKKTEFVELDTKFLEGELMKIDHSCVLEEIEHDKVPVRYRIPFKRSQLEKFQ